MEQQKASQAPADQPSKRSRNQRRRKNRNKQNQKKADPTSPTKRHCATEAMQDVVMGSREEMEDITLDPQSRHQFSDVTFSSLTNVSELSRRAISQVLKFEYMTKVQSLTLPAILQGKDVLSKAKTGSGKTVAFLLPIIEGIHRKRQADGNVARGISALIISPTRELTAQIAVEAKSLTTYHDNINILSLIGGTNINTDRKRLGSPVDIIIATPGRLLDHLQNNSADIVAKIKRSLQVMCLDEADRLLDMGFRPDLQRIFGYLPKQRQTLLFSATLPTSLQEITNLALRPEYTFVDTVGEEENTNAHVVQEYIIAPMESQVPILETLLRQEQTGEQRSSYKIIVFFNTARAAGFFAELFGAAGFPVLELHSRKPQNYRTRIAAEFTKRTQVILFSSDVSARGVDYPGVTLVVQMGLTEREQYVHRLGRTARAGKQGKGVLVLSEEESFFLGKELADLPLTPARPPTIPPSSLTVMSLLHKAFKGDAGGLKGLKASAKMSYSAFLGYYNSNTKRMGMNKADVVVYANRFAAMLGFSEPPELQAKTVGKMGLKGVPGLRIEQGGGHGGGMGRGAGHGGRGNGRGGRR